MLKYIPNTLTIIRFLLIPVIIIACVQEEYIWAIAILTISGLTDILDGTIARKFNFISDFGKLMDPLADKLTQISILTTLFLKGIIPIWILVIVVLKELCMVSGASFLYGKELVVSSKWYGKLATVLFYIAMVLSMFVENISSVMDKKMEILRTTNSIIYYLAVITSIASLIFYMKAFYVQDYLKKEKKKE